jgi:hypothetical protein
MSKGSALFISLNLAPSKLTDPQQSPVSPAYPLCHSLTPQFPWIYPSQSTAPALSSSFCSVCDLKIRLGTKKSFFFAKGFERRLRL